MALTNILRELTPKRVVTSLAISLSALSLSSNSLAEEKTGEGIVVEQTPLYSIKVPKECLGQGSITNIQVINNITNINVNGASAYLPPQQVPVAQFAPHVSSRPGSAIYPIPRVGVAPAPYPYSPYPSRDVRVTNVGPRGAYRVREVHDSRPFGPMVRPVPVRPVPVFRY